jgi:hypothetical protein
MKAVSFRRDSTVIDCRTALLHRCYGTFARCGKNMVKHLQAPPALMNSDIGSS